MNISVNCYSVKQKTIDAVSKDMSSNLDFNSEKYKYDSFNKRFRVSVNANSTLAYYYFVTKPSRKQISRCIRETISAEVSFQREHYEKFGWCRT